MAGQDIITKVLQEIKEDIETLDRLGNCLQTLAQAQEKFEEKTLEVTTDQLKSWSLLCSHVALWVPENMAGAINDFFSDLDKTRPEGQEASEPEKAPDDWELDPATKENLINDVKKLEAVGTELQTMAELICADLDLPRPEAMQERIARKRAARVGGATT